MPLQAVFNYARGAEGPRMESIEGESRPDSPLVATRCRVLDARAHGAALRVRGDGVELLRVPRDAPDVGRLAGAPIKAAHAEMKPFFESVARELTGAATTFCLPPLFRSDTPDKVAESGVTDTSRHASAIRPHDLVHNDYDERFTTFLRKLAGESPAEVRQFLSVRRGAGSAPAADADVARAVLRAKRVLVLQFWGSAQPRGTVIEQHTLAVCLPRSVAPGDLLPVPLPTYGGVRVGDGFNVCVAKAAGAPHHEWVHWPRLTRDEMLCFVGYDSKPRPMAPPLHSAFWDEGVAPGARPRQSFEIRVVCLLDDEETEFLPGGGNGRATAAPAKAATAAL